MPNVSTINNISGLKSIATLNNNDSVLLLGYQNPNDGGGGTFVYDSSSITNDNGATIIIPTANQVPLVPGRWKRMVNGELNIKWFGAIGDGAASDTQAIQNAIKASNDTGVAVIFFPDGQYKIDSQIFLYGNTSLYGNPGKSQIRFSGSFGGAKYVFVLGLIGPGLINTWSNAFIRDLSFIGNNQAQFYYAINTFNVKNVRFENLLFDWTNIDKTSGYGTSIEGLNDSSYSTGPSRVFVKILGCQVVHKQDVDGAEGFGQTNCFDLQISGCKVFGVADDSIGIHGCTNVVVTDNECFSTDGRIYISDSKNVLIDGNYVERIPQQVSTPPVFLTGGALIMVDMEENTIGNLKQCSNIKVVNNTLVFPNGMSGENSTYMARFLGVNGLTCCNNIFETNSNVANSCISIEPKVILTKPNGVTQTFFPTDHILSNNIAKGSYPAPIKENASLASDILGPIYYSLNDAQYLLIGNNSFIVGQIYGYGSPEANIKAPIGSLYSDKSNANNTLWLKISGNGNTGWAQFAILNAPNTFTANQTILNNLNGTALLLATNPNTGALADIRTRISNGTINLDLIVRGTGYTNNPNAGLIAISGNNPLSFYNNGTEKARLLGNGNWIFQNNGVFTDDGNQVQIKGSVSVRQIVGSSATPAITAGDGAGTGANINIIGNNLGGIITITTGTSPLSSSTILTVSYTGSGFNLESYPIISSANIAAAALYGNSQIYAIGTALSFTLNTGTTPLTSATTYKWNYIVTGKS